MEIDRVISLIQLKLDETLQGVTFSDLEKDSNFLTAKLVAKKKKIQEYSYLDNFTFIDTPENGIKAYVDKKFCERDCLASELQILITEEQYLREKTLLCRKYIDQMKSLDVAKKICDEYNYYTK